MTCMKSREDLVMSNPDLLADTTTTTTSQTSAVNSQTTSHPLASLDPFGTAPFNPGRFIHANIIWGRWIWFWGYLGDLVLLWSLYLFLNYTLLSLLSDRFWYNCKSLLICRFRYFVRGYGKSKLDHFKSEIANAKRMQAHLDLRLWLKALWSNYWVKTWFFFSLYILSSI